MLRLLADENFHRDIVRGVLDRQPDLDLIRAQDAGRTGLGDPELLAWAATAQRILLSHDAATIPDHAYQRLAAGNPLAGVFIVNNRLPLHHAIEEVLLVAACSEQDEWRGRVVYLPL